MNPQPYRKIWLLRMVLPGRWGRWLTSLLIFSTMFLLFATTGIWADSLAGPNRSAAFFFCVLLAYIIPVFHYICERTRLSLLALTPVLAVEVAEIAIREASLIHKPRKWGLIVVSIGFAAGVAHNALLLEILPSTLWPAVMLMMATMSIWLVMTTVVLALVHNAYIFSHLTEHLNVDLLNTAALKPFATVAVMSTLAMIGAQAAFPLMLIDGEINTLTYLPGLVATAGPMLLHEIQNINIVGCNGFYRICRQRRRRRYRKRSDKRLRCGN